MQCKKKESKGMKEKKQNETGGKPHFFQDEVPWTNYSSLKKKAECIDTAPQWALQQPCQ